MKNTVEDFEKIVKFPHFLHLTSINWLVLKITSCFDTCVECSVNKGQNSLDDNLCKSDVQVDIYVKLLSIKLNPTVFLLIPKDWLVCNFKSSVGEISVSCYLFIIISSLKGHSYLKYIRYFAKFGTNCTI